MAACRAMHVVLLVAFTLAQAEIGVADGIIKSPKDPEWDDHGPGSVSGRRLKKKACRPEGEDFKCTFMGRLLPLGGKGETEWPNAIRLIMYLLGLGYMFLGIAIISDVFMAAIEKVTSWKMRVKDKKTGRTVTVYIWNATVANLSLMALGSSAPEILLSLIEITSDEMFLGDLGAGTIVGSAAFNLLCISAVCVMAIPEGEVRYIKQTIVYAVTATWSVFAYMWLMFILMVTSPNVCETWEAILTLLFCPLLVLMAYMADRGWFSFGQGNKDQERDVLEQTIPDDVTQDEIAMIEQQIRESHGADLSSEQVVSVMCAKYFTKRSRAYYRQLAIQKTIGGSGGRRTTVAKSSVASYGMFPPDLTISKPIDTVDTLAREKRDTMRVNAVTIGFESARYAFLENCGMASVIIVRAGPLQCKVSVDFKTRDGTATSVEDYQSQSGTVTFEPNEERKTISIKVLDDNAYEENEEFYIDLSDPRIDDAASVPELNIKLSDTPSVICVIIDDDLPGVLKWQMEEVEVTEKVEGSIAEILVERVGGASGKISCKYETEDMNAVAGMDYESVSGKIELGPNVQNALVQVPINPKGRYEKTSSFIVRLTDPVGCIFDKETDGGEECCICHVTIKGNQGESRMNVLKRMESRINTQQAMLGHKHYAQQFYDALFTVINDDGESDDDDGEESSGPTKFDYFMHFVSVPWKVLFAFVPPVDYCGGWLCFMCALGGIALVTAVVGDLANLVGCCIDIDPEITAITFVALGTSLPDTFASKTAAMMDPYADASIGNITGSNSVNVFIGLGLSWTLASVYWETMGEPTAKWTSRVFDPAGDYYPIREDITKVMDAKGLGAVFVVPRGTLWFNLMVFSMNALFALQHLFQRRRRFGGELGGPMKGFMGQYFSAFFLFFQWVIYVAASSAWATSQNASDCP